LLTQRDHPDSFAELSAFGFGNWTLALAMCWQLTQFMAKINVLHHHHHHLFNKTD